MDIESIATLATAGWLAAAALMAALWRSQRYLGKIPKAAAVQTALVAALAILYAVRADHGAPGRRVAIASMIGSWGASRAIYLLYGGSLGQAMDSEAVTRSFWYFQSRSLAAVFLSLPALLAVVNPSPEFSLIEYAGAALWVVAFIGQSTVDRRRQTSILFEPLAWTAYALFASGSPYGWIAFACPIAVLADRLSRRPTLIDGRASAGP